MAGHVVLLKRNSDYCSKAGDARRSGRVAIACRTGQVRVGYYETAAAIEVRLGVVTVGVITHDVTSKGYFWSVYLPGFSSMPRSARDVEAAKSAVLHKVREWCAAARLIMTGVT